MTETEQCVSLVKRTPVQLAREIIANLDKEYDLVYVDYRDQLTDEQTAIIVAGSDDLFMDDDLERFESDQRWDSVQQIINEGVEAVIDQWESEDDADYADVRSEFEDGPLFEVVRCAIDDRDSGTWLQELVDHTPSVLLRIAVLDEDHGYAFEQVDPQEALTRIGIPVTEDNLTVMRETLNECSPEFSVLLGYWIVGASVADLFKLDGAVEEVEIVNPYLYLGNPFAGSGWISEKPFTGTVRVARNELRTDKDAFGYPVDKIYGGLSPSSFEADIKAVTTHSSKEN